MYFYTCKKIIHKPLTNKQKNIYDLQPQTAYIRNKII